MLKYFKSYALSSIKMEKKKGYLYIYRGVTNTPCSWPLVSITNAIL